VATSAADVHAALKTTWDAAGSLSSIAGPYFDRAPNNPAYPYAIFRPVANVARTRTSSSEFWDHPFRFHIFAKNKVQAETLLAAVGDVFDVASLSLASGKGHVLHMRREGEFYQEHDQGVFETAIEYKLLRRKPKPT
jgi:hypothetical protein